MIRGCGGSTGPAENSAGRRPTHHVTGLPRNHDTPVDGRLSCEVGSCVRPRNGSYTLLDKATARQRSRGRETPVLGWSTGRDFVSVEFPPS
jgi:hypothetical protein